MLPILFMCSSITARRVHNVRYMTCTCVHRSPLIGLVCTVSCCKYPTPPQCITYMFYLKFHRDLDLNKITTVRVKPCIKAQSAQDLTTCDVIAVDN